MRFSVATVLLLLSAAGCHQDTSPTPRAAYDPTMFAPVAMRIHPIFTQVKDWSGAGKPDGIEALLEFQDRFGNATKVSGRVIFELFEYRKDFPDPRGKRLVNPWVGALDTADQQRAHWNRTSQTYSFQLADPDISPDHNYVLTAMFDLSGGGRFFSQMILRAQPREKKSENSSNSTAVPESRPNTDQP